MSSSQDVVAHNLEILSALCTLPNHSGPYLLTHRGLVQSMVWAYFWRKKIEFLQPVTHRNIFWLLGVDVVVHHIWLTFLLIKNGWHVAGICQVEAERFDSLVDLNVVI